MANARPNRYELKGGETTVSYSTDSLAGQPRLTYANGQQSQSFSGDQIRSLSTEIGTLVTVSLTRSVDIGFTSFSLLVPDIELAADQPQQFKTTGIVTRHKGPDTVPATGARETYEFVHLHGTASLVFSVAAEAQGAGDAKR